jgi:hypothetical protein
VGVAIQGARISHIPIQKHAEEIVAQISVLVDVAAASGDGIPLDAMAHLMKQAIRDRKQRAAAFEFTQVAPGSNSVPEIGRGEVPCCSTAHPLLDER